MLTGGAGNDTFLVESHPSAAGVAGLDRITDFTHGEDRLVFGEHVTLTDGAFGVGTAATYDDALALARDEIGSSSVNVAAIQVGSDVIVFADADHHDHIDAAVVLVGKTLADLGAIIPS